MRERSESKKVKEEKGKKKAERVEVSRRETGVSTPNAGAPGMRLRENAPHNREKQSPTRATAKKTSNHYSP